MRNIMFALILLLAMPIAVPQAVQPQPQQTCDQNLILTRMLSEHQQTRKYTNDALQQKIDYFYTEFNDRIVYLEGRVDEVIREMVVKLSALMIGITLFISSFYAMLLAYFRKKTYTNLKKDVIEEISKEVQMHQQIQTGIDPHRTYGQQMPPPPPPMPKQDRADELISMMRQ
jgi:hypothetical protein